MNIGQKLKNKRTQSGLTQEAVAEKIGVSRQTVSNWENNRSYPDIVSILRLSDLYEVSLDEFLKEDADSLYYQVTVEAGDALMLSCYQSDSLQWKYRLRRMDYLVVAYSASPNLLNAVQAGSFRAQWFPEEEDYDIPSLGAIETLSEFSIALNPSYPAESLTVYEDYCRDGELSTTVLRLQRNENGVFSLKSAPYHDSGTRYIIYRIPHNGGEYVFCVNFP